MAGKKKPYLKISVFCIVIIVFAISAGIVYSFVKKQGIAKTETGQFSINIKEGSTIYQINAGDASGSSYYTNDMNYTEGESGSTEKNVDRSGASMPAPIGVYQTERYGENGFSYTLPDLSPGAVYKIRLHFADTLFAKAGERKFHVDINGERRLKDFDIIEDAGANRAVVKELNVLANDKGQIKIEFVKGSSQYPMVNGIEIIYKSAPAPEADVGVLKYNLLGTNYSSSCRRPFGAGLYDSVSNKTFICWNGDGQDIYVKEFDHNTGIWSEPVMIKDNNYYTYYDYHNYPTMVMGSDGKLLVYYCRHSERLIQVKAPYAGSISGEWTTTTVSKDKTAYPMPVVAGKDIYLFFSRNDSLEWPHRSYKYVKSSDNGETWSASTVVIDSERMDPERFDEVYSWGVSYNTVNNRIGITWCMAGGFKDGKPTHNGGSKNLYFAYLDPADGLMKDAAGNELGTSINRSEFKSCLVHAYTGDPNSAQWAEQHPFDRPQPSFMDSNGNPVVAYGLYEKNKLAGSIKLAKWNGAEWVISNIAIGTNWFYDIENIGNDNLRAMYHDGDKLVIKRSTDGAATWQLESDDPILFTGGCRRIHEIQFIESGRPGIQAFVGEFFHDPKTTYNYHGKYHMYTIGY